MTENYNKQNELNNYIGNNDGMLLTALEFYRKCYLNAKSNNQPCLETNCTANELREILATICNQLEEVNYVCNYTRSIL